jgi:SAM-dependent methyltransferase
MPTSTTNQLPLWVSIYKQLHNTILHDYRMDVLANEIVALLPTVSSILDIGCGDGDLEKRIQAKLPQRVAFQGVDIDNKYGQATIDVYDGCYLPYPDNSFDVTFFCDVLHHVTDIKSLLAEGVRTSSKYILIKEHHYYSALDYHKLKFMDYVGNRAYGVDNICNYQNEPYWLRLFDELNLEVIGCKKAMSLYRPPLSWCFGDRLSCLYLVKKK